MKNLYVVMIFLLAMACAQKESTQAEELTAGFDLEGSDPAAIELADSIIQTMGGAESWQAVRFMTWTHTGRAFYYDKKEAKARIESDDTIALLDLRNKTGRVQIGSQPDDATLATFQQIWQESVYDLIIPFELKNSGATMTYMGEDTLRGQRFNSLELTFSSRSDKYKFYVDKHSKLIRFGAYYKQAQQEKEDLLHNWDNYQKLGATMLSFNRSDGMGPQQVRIEESLPETLFTEF